MECPTCERKKILRSHRLQIARQKAAQRAKDEKKTMAIWEEGIYYHFGDEPEAGARVIEYVSQYSKIAAS